MRHWMLANTALALLALGFAAALSAGGNSAGAADYETPRTRTARIEARALADGRTEFAIVGHGQAARALPPSRMFPAGSGATGWLRSGVVRFPLAGDGYGVPSRTWELRAEARRLADGRIEFALGARTDDGAGWTRHLPRSRFFPADAPAGRWLKSSRVEFSTGRWYFREADNLLGRADTDAYAITGRTIIALGCDGGAPWARVSFNGWWLPVNSADTGVARLDDGAAHRFRWHSIVRSGREAVIASPVAFARALAADGEWLHITPSLDGSGAERVRVSGALRTIARLPCYAAAR